MARFTKLLAAGAALMLASGAQAAAVFAPSGGLVTDHDPGNPVNLANVFTPTVNSFATRLGFYTPTNLVGGGELVGLYNAAGTLLTSAFVAATTSTPGQYVFQAIAPVLLTAGQQYSVVNNVGQNAWAYGGVTATGATFNYNAYTYGAALANGSSVGGSGPAYFGPNVDITAVPEPATWAMMIAGIGAVGFSLRSRKRQAVKVTYA